MKNIFSSMVAMLAAYAIAAPTSLSMPSTEIMARDTSALSSIVARAGVTLTVTTSNNQKLVVEVDPDFAALLNGVNLPSADVAVGTVIATASNLIELLANLVGSTTNLVSAVRQDGSVVLISLSNDIASLLSGLGLPGVNVPVGTIIGTLPAKREVASAISASVNTIVTITGLDGTHISVQLSASVADIITGIDLPNLGLPIGTVTKTATSITDLVKDLGSDVQDLVTVVGKNGQFLLVELVPLVTDLLADVELPSVTVAIGTVL